MPFLSRDADPIFQQKQVLRRLMRERLAALTDRASRSERLCAAIVASDDWASASCVAMFAPMRREPDIDLLWPHASEKMLVFPAIRGTQLELAVVREPIQLLPGALGVREPGPECARIAVNRIELALVPGTAFTVAGERLGRGGGFYDRLLATPGFRARRIGVCFDCQVSETLPVEPHDQRVERVVTESGFQGGR